VAIVRFTSQDLEAEVPLGTTLLAAARLAHAPVGSACGVTSQKVVAGG
jgi:ferredoxin